MRRDKFILFAMISLFVTEFAFILPVVFKDKPLLVLIPIILISGQLLFTSYLLIFKKSYNLLSGMTEEDYERIKDIPDENEKMIRTAKIIGYFLMIISIFLPIFAYFSLI